MTKARLDKIATIEDLARVARRRIPKITLGYLESGTGGEIALRRNREAPGDQQPDRAAISCCAQAGKTRILETDRVSVRSDTPAIADFR
jgi:hypothetical protein